VPFQSCTPWGGLNLRHHDHTCSSMYSMRHGRVFSTAAASHPHATCK
jgi:hypothetical protein